MSLNQLTWCAPATQLDLGTKHFFCLRLPAPRFPPCHCSKERLVLADRQMNSLHIQLQGCHDTVRPAPHLHKSLSAILIAGLLNIVGFPRLPADEMDVSMQVLSKIEQDYGNFALQRVLKWYKLIDDYKDASTQDKLELVNNFFNQLAFVNDSEMWGQEDYWATRYKCYLRMVAIVKTSRLQNTLHCAKWVSRKSACA